MSGHQVRSEIDSRDRAEQTASHKIHAPLKYVRRWLFFLVVSASCFTGIATMADIMLSGGLTLLEICLLILFSVTFTWIVISFWNGMLGFTLQMLRLDPLSLKRLNKSKPNLRNVNSRIAVVMPIYNEDTARVMAGFESVIKEIEQSGQMDKFDFYLLSDTQKEEIIESERQAWKEFCQTLAQPLADHVFYRRRRNNAGRKVGNLADFCERWGSYYDHMLVLDADSLMTKECIIQLALTLEDNPKAALIQTVPIPVRQQTFFGRFLQFAATLHSPMLANGLAFWQTDSANYWGHNAMIRISAFMDCCGLPSIPGSGPFSGDILSHDFVEAALLRRAGWHVYLLPNLEGSYEEVPSNLIEYATRDRRWVQGNIQHLALLKSTRLHSISRLHFAFGAIAYITTLLWLLMLTLSTADALWRAFSPKQFFTSSYQLFPDWPVDNSAMIYSMFYVTIGLLLLPKLLAVLTTLFNRRKAFGGVMRLTWGATVETVFAILIAPLMMIFHSYFVVSVFLGRKVGWNAQLRDGRIIPWGESLKRTLTVTVLAAIWGGVTLYAAPDFFLWLTPVLIGLVLAAPIVRYSSSEHLGFIARKLQLFVVPSEIAADEVIRFVDAYEHDKMPQKTSTSRLLPKLLPAKWRKMHLQSFDDVA